MMNKLDWMNQRNAGSGPMRTNHYFPATSGPPVAAPSQPMPQRPMGYTGGTQTGFGQNWFQQNRPALEQWFQQQMGMRPTGLFPFNPIRR